MRRDARMGDSSGFRYNGKIIGNKRGRQLIKRGKQAVLFRAMDGFGMPTGLVDKMLATMEHDSSKSVRVFSQGGNPGLVQTDGSEESDALRINTQPTGAVASFDTVEIHYDDVIYQAPLSAFKEHGIPYHKPPFEPQYILPRKYFISIDSKQLRMV